MPNCFQLFPKGTTQPAILQQVDEAICQAFDTPVHPKYWYCNWYNVIGFLIAMGKGHLGSPELRQAVIAWYDAPDSPYQQANEPDTNEYRDCQLAVLAWLEERYTSTAFVEIGRGLR